MALRTEILRAALPLIPQQSFTRSTLLSSLRSIRPEISDTEGVIDMIFGGSSSAGKALVDHWENEGRATMSSSSGAGREEKERGSISLDLALQRRLEYSSVVAEHLVEAYAQLSLPSSTPSLPIPALPSTLIHTFNSLHFSFPKSYSPPSSSSSSPSSSSSRSNPTSSILSYLSEPHRLPLLSINPLGPISYAWKIADEALYISTPSSVGRPQKIGYWNEPTGAGPEWYAHRIALSLAYISAESHLLQPYPSTQTQINPHLPLALSALNKNINRYRNFIRSAENTEQGLGEAMGFAEFVGRSWKGLIKSRYW